MTIRTQDGLLYAGGECLDRFGVPFWRASRPQELAGTFARATAGVGLIDPRGVYRYAAANRLRFQAFDLDGDGLREATALMLERSSANLATRSEEFGNAAWAKNGLTLSADARAGGDGAATADKLIPTAASAQHYAEQTITATADGTFSLQIVSEADEDLYLGLSGLEAGGAWFGALFNVSSGAIESEAASGTGSVDFASIEALADGRFLLTVVGDVGSGATSIDMRVAVCSSSAADPVGDTFTGNGSDGLYVWGANFNDSPTPASYMAAVAGPASKVDETLSIPFYPPLQACTLYAKVRSGAYGQSGRILRWGEFTAPYFGIQRSSATQFQAFHTNSSFATNADVTGTPDRDQLVEVVGHLYADGSVDIGFAVEGGALTLAGRTPALTGGIVKVPGDREFQINGPSTVWSAAYFAVKAVRGVHGVDAVRNWFPPIEKAA